MITIFILNFVCLTMFSSELIKEKSVKISASLILLLSFAMSLLSVESVFAFFVSFGLFQIFISFIKNLSKQ